MNQALVIGASSGIGFELAQMIAASGWRVHALARRVSLLEILRDSHPESITFDCVDVTETVQTQTVLIVHISFCKFSETF